MAVTLHCNRIHNSTTTGHSQLVRSLERILEEANLSGELLLANRKLKDFPKAATKYNLSDTVIADLSRNRFCELPEEVTTFAFLETLLLFHNTIRHIPESVKHLTLLTYLDLRSNQLSTLPRELCFMPLQVLLVSNNRLVSLPEELGRMDKLTDLDASYNQLTALPSRIGELRSLKSFSLRNNQILYLPRELACLSLVSLDVSNNRIANLPLEIRQMTTLVEFNLGNNPLTSPPASLCVRGLVHIFKFLETQASKEEKGCRAGGNYDGYTTLRRAPKQHAGSIFESARTPRNQTEFGYNTCDGLEKRWSHETPNRNIKSELSSPRKILTPTTVDNFLLDVSTTNSEAIVSKGSPGGTKTQSSPERSFSDQSQVNDENVSYTHSSSTSSGSTPEDDMLIESQAFIDKNNKQGGNVQQTYREYKEALKQQRNQEISSVYKAKPKTHHEMNETNGTNNMTINYDETESRCKEAIANNIADDTISVPKKPVQKVIPSRNMEIMDNVFHPKAKEKSSSQNTNGECIGYVKPNSPMKMLVNGDISTNNNPIATNGVVRNKFAAAVPSKQQLHQQQQQQQFLAQNKTNRSVTWNHDLPPEKLSFTMRREFDRQREETELMMQLRNIIQVRLKTILPEDMASALTDGVILCHLANYVRPRSVASIHVPSPGVSKLTMARCRRNVDNFLEACRKIGVDEELICSCEDVVPPDDDDDDDDSSLTNDASHRPAMPNPSAVFQTVSALLLINSNTQSDRQDFHQVQQHQDHHQQQHQQSMEEHQPPATNMQLTEKWENKVNAIREMTTTTKEQQHDEDAVVGTKEGQFGKFLRHAKIKTFQKIKLNLTTNNGGFKFTIGGSGNKDCQLQTIEETEGDSYQIVNEKISPVVLKVNDLNTLKFKLLEITPSNNNNDDGHDHETEIRVNAANCIVQSNATVVSETSGTPKMVTKRIEFFEDRCSPSGDVNNSAAKNIYSIFQATNAAAASKNVEDERLLSHDFNVLTIVLSCVFIATFVLLVIFPLPD